MPTLPQAGATLSGEYATGPGGKGFNQAIAARRAGAATGFVCALGDDLGAQLARVLCTADGIDLRDVVVGSPTGTAGIYVDAQGRNCIVIGAGANAALQPAFVDEALSTLQRGDVLVTQLESPIDAVAHALDAGRAAGATTLLNPAPANVAVDHAMLERVDILTPNETEFVALLGRHVGDAHRGRRGLRHRPATPARALPRPYPWHRDRHPGLERLLRLACRVEPARRRQPPATGCRPITVRAIDTTGAGDAFNGALAASLALKPERGFAEHVRFAVRYASRSTELYGAALAMPRMPVE